MADCDCLNNVDQLDSVLDEVAQIDSDLENVVEVITSPKIMSVSVNGENIEPDENKNVNIEIPTKTSGFENDGDGTSPYATEDFVETNGGKIDSISIDGVNQTIDENKNVDLKGLASTTFVEETVFQIESSLNQTIEDVYNKKADKTELFSGSYNDLTDKPTLPTALNQLSEDSTHRVVTDTEKATWNAKSDFSGSYNDLTDQPEIPSIDGLASEDFVNNAVADKATTNYVDTKVADLVNSAPETLDTLGELATALEENQDIVETLNSAISNKADKFDLETLSSDIDSNYVKKTTTGSVSYNTYDYVDAENKDGIMIGSFVGTDAPVMDGTQNVQGTTIREEATSGALSHIKMADAVTTSTDIAVDETQASLTYMKNDGSSEGTNVSQNGIFVQEDMLSGQIYKVSTDAETGVSTTKASNISLSTDEASIIHQSTVGEETISSVLSLKDGTAYLNDKELATKDDVSVDTSNLVDLASDQTISGTKTFSSNINLGISDFYIKSTFAKVRSFVVGGGGNYFGNGKYAVALSPSTATRINNFDVLIGSETGGDIGDSSSSKRICVGFGAKASASDAIQLGSGTNSTSNTFQVFSYQLLDSEGKIPNERLNITFDTATTDEIDALFT